MRIVKAPTLLLFVLLSTCLRAQVNSQLTDGRNVDPWCIGFQQLIDSKPKEVLFGVHIQENGDVYFMMDNISWFDKLFVPGTGIAADIVSKDRYDCAKATLKVGLFRGYVLPVLKYENFSSHRQSLTDGSVMLKIGKVPRELQKKQLEANLVVTYRNRVCYYTNFVDIDRAVWDLLPMGFYMDTLLHFNPADTLTGKQFSYQRVAEVVVPFEKSKDTYNGSRVQKIIDSLGLRNCNIRLVDIRAYSSVEGAESVNRQLMKGRANAMVAILKTIQPDLKRINILTAENWMEFYRDIHASRFKVLAGVTRPEIKLRLQNRTLADSVEAILAKERKAIMTVYYEPKRGPQEMPREALLAAFSQAVSAKAIVRARSIQRRIFDLINDDKLPESYLDRLEVPKEKTYWELINDRILFEYQISLSDQDDAFRAFEELRALDPGNGKINYNLCAFALMRWHVFDSVDQRRLLADINLLEGQGIARSLVKRLLVNYNILLSNYLLREGRYDEKDKSVQFIKDSYEPLSLTDQDRFSLAKYFAYYSQNQWAEDLIAHRVDQLDVSEDLVFYYVNLGFYKADHHADDRFANALINCFILNRERFCRFFKSIDKGGAGMQLMEDDEFKQLYCEKCRRDD